MRSLLIDQRVYSLGFKKVIVAWKWRASRDRYNKRSPKFHKPLSISRLSRQLLRQLLKNNSAAFEKQFVCDKVVKLSVFSTLLYIFLSVLFVFEVYSYLLKHTLSVNCELLHVQPCLSIFNEWYLWSDSVARDSYRENLLEFWYRQTFGIFKTFI